MAEGYGKLAATDPDGWQKEYILSKPLVYAGSGPADDIRLNHPQVSPRQIQIMQLQPSGARVVNLGAAEITVGRGQPAFAGGGAASNGGASSGGAVTMVGPRKSADIDDGDWLDIFGFRLVYHGSERVSNNFQVRMDLSSTTIAPDRPLDGAVVINHIGDIAGVQFKIDLQGYDPQWTQVDPGPLLFPGVERSVSFRLAHTKGPLPPAGSLTITAVVTAPAEYPGDIVAVRRAITVAPYRAFQVRVEPAPRT